MPKVTYVKAAKQRYVMVPVLDDEGDLSIVDEAPV